MTANNKPPNQKGDRLKTIVRYSSIGSEMVIAVVVPVVIGQKLDNNRASDVPIFTVIFGLLGVAYVLYKIFKISAS